MDGRHLSLRRWENAASDQGHGFGLGEKELNVFDKKADIGNILKFGDMGNRDAFWDYDYHSGVLLGDWDRDAGKHHRRCFVTDAAAIYRALFRPQCAESLAMLAGCTVSDLPDVLQNWRRKKPYVGNDILSRLDPVDTEIHDPWMDLKLNVSIYLSKRGYARVQKGDPITAKEA